MRCFGESPCRWPRGLAWILAIGLAGCATSPPEDDAGRTSRAPAESSLATPVHGEVLARSDRLLIYRPGEGDDLRSIAARFLGSEANAWMIGEFNGVSRTEAGEPLVVPLKPFNPTGVHADHYQTVPILCYHRFGPGNDKMVVSPANFAAQLDWLAANGYHVVRLEQLAGYLRGENPLPQRSVVITIDDGYESVHRHALPVLKKHGFAATLFVYTDFIGAGDALSWVQLRDLAASGLIDIQAHSKSHRKLIDRAPGDSDQQYRQWLEVEARVPREMLEKRLPVKVKHYAFPYGDANEMVRDVLARQQYELAVTVNPGGNAFFAQPLMLKRTMIFGDHDLDAFKARLQVSRPLGAP